MPRRQPFGSHSLPTAIFVVGLAALVCACTPTQEVVAIDFWIWSDGHQAEQLRELVARYNASQDRVVVSCESWPTAVRGDRSPARAIAALGAKVHGKNVPSLIEIPDSSLPALVEAELIRDVGGRFAERLGVRYDDYQPGLMPAARVQTKGVVALPLYHEAPVLLVPAGASYGEATRRAGLSGLLTSAAADESAPAPARPLAAALDYRIFLALLQSTAALEVEAEEGRAALDLAKTRQAVELWQQLFPAGPLEPGERGERQAVAELKAGRVRAAWAWSTTLGELSARDLQVLRAPGASRGTYLAVYAKAPWRSRQAAFRVARWLTEPLQSAELAARFWTIPIRKSAATSARYRAAKGAAEWRELVARDEAPLRLPASGNFIDTLIKNVEPALVKGAVDDDIIERLQRSLATTDE